MSLSWTKTRIAITPGHVAVSSGGAYRESPLASTAVDDILKSLVGLLDGLGAQGRAELTLSHQLAPVWLLPAPPVRLNWQETQGWVRDHLSVQFGDLASGWRLAWNAVPAGEPIPASSVESTWLDGLLDALHSKGIQPRCVQPWLVAASNRHRRTLGKGPVWLALAEPGRVTLAGVERGRIQAIRSAIVEDSPARLLADMLERERLLGSGVTSRRVWLQAIHVDADWRGLSGDLDIRELSPPSAGLAMMMGA